MFDFFKREIRVTRNIDECNKIRELLLENNIQTYVITNTLTNPGRHHGIAFIQMDAAYEYQIFVKRKDWEKANIFSTQIFFIQKTDLISKKYREGQLYKDFTSSYI